MIIDGLFWLARHDENQIEAEHVDVDLDDLLFEEFVTLYKQTKGIFKRLNRF